MQNTALVNVRFYRNNYGFSALTVDTRFRAYSNGSTASTKTRLIRSLKHRLEHFYPGVRFVLNFVNTPVPTLSKERFLDATAPLRRNS